MAKVYMAETRIPKSFCPFCFHALDRVSNVYGDDPPVPGDFTICINCGSVLSFDDNMQLNARSLTESPIQIRAKLAQIKMLIGEMKKELNARERKPWEI